MSDGEEAAVDGIRTVGERRTSFVRALTRASGSVALRNAAVFIAIMIGVFTIKYFAEILTPLVVAVFLLLLVDGFSRFMKAKLPSWPGWVRSTVGVVLIVAGFGTVVGICIRYGRSFVIELLGMQGHIDKLLTQASDRFHLDQPLTIGHLFRGNVVEAAQSFFGAAGHVAAEAFLVVIILGFMLASRRAFGKKADRMFKTPQAREHASRIFDAVRNASEQYVGLQTIKATALALVGWGIMTAVGLQDALFLAFLIFLAAYVPIIGPLVAAVLPAIFGLAEFDSPVRAIILLVLLGSAIFLIDNIIMPKLQSDRLNLDPVVILLSLGFWGILLGAPGALLSTPLTVVVMAVSSEFDGARWFALLLSKEGELIVDAPDA
jgi:predicted PurR-regulated permease PerM